MNNILKKNRTCAIIPFFNEENTIAEIIEQTLQHVDFVIAINDGSTDKSYQRIPISNRVIVLTNTENKGKGYSLNIGFRKSIEFNTEFTVTLDADNQHPPEFIPIFFEKLLHNDIVIGNRLGNISNMPPQRILSNKITSFLMTVKTKQSILDSQCGFRAFRTSVLHHLIPTYSGFEAESEILIKAARNKLKIDYVKIPTIYGNEKSKIKPIQTIYGFLRVLFI